MCLIVFGCSFSIPGFRNLSLNFDLPSILVCLKRDFIFNDVCTFEYRLVENYDFDIGFKFQLKQKIENYPNWSL